MDSSFPILQSTALRTELSKVNLIEVVEMEMNTVGQQNGGNMQNASTGNRTRAARVAGEHSTTEPSMLIFFSFWVAGEHWSE